MSIISRNHCFNHNNKNIQFRDFYLIVFCSNIHSLSCNAIIFAGPIFSVKNIRARDVCQYFAILPPTSPPPVSIPVPIVDRAKIQCSTYTHCWKQTVRIRVSKNYKKRNTFIISHNFPLFGGYIRSQIRVRGSSYVQGIREPTVSVVQDYWGHAA